MRLGNIFVFQGRNLVSRSSLSRVCRAFLADLDTVNAPSGIMDIGFHQSSTLFASLAKPGSKVNNCIQSIDILPIAARGGADMRAHDHFGQFSIAEPDSLDTLAMMRVAALQIGF